MSSGKETQENEKGPPRHPSFPNINDNAQNSNKNLKLSPRKNKKTTSFSKNYRNHHHKVDDDDDTDFADDEEAEKSTQEENEEIVTPTRTRSSSGRRHHMSRRASIFDFEYEFPNSPPRPTIKMITRSSSVNSPFFSNIPSPTRSSSRPYVKPPVRIQTPEWEDLSAKRSQTENEGSTDNEKGEEERVDLGRIEEERRNNHIQLEYFETRIQNGDDKQHMHPVQAHEMAESGMTIVMTHEEYNKTNRYKQVNYVPRVPTFWEPRVWDNKENQMDAHETEVLEQNIQLSYENKALDEEEYYHDSSTASSRRKNKKSKKNRAFLSIPIYDFMTNSTDEDTDWNDYM